MAGVSDTSHIANMAVESLCACVEEGQRGREQAVGRERWLGLTPAAVPYLLAASDTVYGLASGMTIKFFPVFWIQEVQLSPMAVQAMAAAVPFLLALSSYAMHPLALCVGASTHFSLSVPFPALKWGSCFVFRAATMLPGAP
jgi:hypothetical protein